MSYSFFNSVKKKCSKKTHHQNEKFTHKKKMLLEVLSIDFQKTLLMN